LPKKPWSAVSRPGSISADSARRLNVPSSTPPTRATTPAAVKLIGRIRDHSATPVTFVPGRGDLRLHGLLAGRDLVVHQRHLRLQGVAGVVVVGVLLGLDDGARHRIHPEVRWAA